MTKELNVEKKRGVSNNLLNYKGAITMDKIKREYSFRTTDGVLHSGGNAAKRAKEHQKMVDFHKAIKGMIPEVRRIFNIKDAHTTDESILLEKVGDHMLVDCDDLEELVGRLVDVYIEIPEIVTLFTFIKDRFERFR